MLLAVVVVVFRRRKVREKSGFLAESGSLRKTSDNANHRKPGSTITVDSAGLGGAKSVADKSMYGSPGATATQPLYANSYTPAKQPLYANVDGETSDFDYASAAMQAQYENPVYDDPVLIAAENVGVGTVPTEVLYADLEVGRRGAGERPAQLTVSEEVTYADVDVRSLAVKRGSVIYADLSIDLRPPTTAPGSGTAEKSDEVLYGEIDFSKLKEHEGINEIDA